MKVYFNELSKTPEPVFLAPIEDFDIKEGSIGLYSY
jgi:hypothetical protein